MLVEHILREEYYKAGRYYFDRSQYASAITFFLHGAEDAADRHKAYECMLFVALSLKALGRREDSLEHVLLTLFNIDERRPEAPYLLSILYESKKSWMLSYTMANLAYFNSCETTLKNTDYYHGYLGCKFQKGVAAWWLGKTDEARELMYEVYAKSSTRIHREAALRNLRSIGYPRVVNNINTSKQPRFDITVDHNYSQSMQDVFVITALRNISYGVYVEIGSADPVYCNNTLLLETAFNWAGVSYDISAADVAKFNLLRKNMCYLQDATTYNGLPPGLDARRTVDYLQVDCEPPNVSYNALVRFMGLGILPKVITFEHDAHTGVNGIEVRTRSRNLLQSYGYDLVVPNVCFEHGSPYEDWWIHSSVEHDMPFSKADMVMPHDYFYYD